MIEKERLSNTAIEFPYSFLLCYYVPPYLMSEESSSVRSLG